MLSGNSFLFKIPKLLELEWVKHMTNVNWTIALSLWITNSTKLLHFFLTHKKKFNTFCSVTIVPSLNQSMVKQAIKETSIKYLIDYYTAFANCFQVMIFKAIKSAICIWNFFSMFPWLTDMNQFNCLWIGERGFSEINAFPSDRTNWQLIFFNFGRWKWRKALIKS